MKIYLVHNLTDVTVTIVAETTVESLKSTISNIYVGLRNIGNSYDSSGYSFEAT